MLRREELSMYWPGTPTHPRFNGAGLTGKEVAKNLSWFFGFLFLCWIWIFWLSALPAWRTPAHHRQWIIILNYNCNTYPVLCTCTSGRGALGSWTVEKEYLSRISSDIFWRIILTYSPPALFSIGSNVETIIRWGTLPEVCRGILLPVLQ